MDDNNCSLANACQVLQSGGLRPLVELLGAADQDVQANSAGAIQSVCFQVGGLAWPTESVGNTISEQHVYLREGQVHLRARRWSGPSMVAGSDCSAPDGRIAVLIALGAPGGGARMRLRDGSGARAGGPAGQPTPERAGARLLRLIPRLTPCLLRAVMRIFHPGNVHAQGMCTVLRCQAGTNREQPRPQHLHAQRTRGHCQSDQQTARSAPGQHARRQARAAGALHNLSADAAAIALIRGAGGVAPLVALLRRAACPRRDADCCVSVCACCVTQCDTSLTGV